MRKASEIKDKQLIEYLLSLTEDEALNLARKCQSFDFDEVNFDCFNVDNGVEATRHYFLSCVDIDF